MTIPMPDGKPDPYAKQDTRRLASREFSCCGCCGKPITRGERWPFCAPCRAHGLGPHTTPGGMTNPPWERTWFAVHGTDCPYQIPEVALNG